MRCPGQDRRYWKAEDVFEISCPACGQAVEFFKGDLLRRCPGCGHRFQNPRLDLGCAEWCPQAEECLGLVARLPQSARQYEGPLVSRLIQAVKREFGSDRKRLTHALAVLTHAKGILREETGDPRVVQAAALLHDIGIQEAERKHGSAAARYQEIEGPPLARRILVEIGLDEATTEHVCRIVGSHHSAQDIDSPEFRVVWDADWLLNLPEEFPEHTADQLKPVVERLFKTEAGKRRACDLFVEGKARVEG